MDASKIDQLYNEESINWMKCAEEALERGANRLVEIRNFAETSGVQKIGIAHCIAVQSEMNVVKEFLGQTFEVVTIDCKCGQVVKNEMIGMGGDAVSCNPAGQAFFLAENNTQLNVAMGLCVGHDMVFNQCSKAPVTTLLVKDRVNKHNAMESIRQIAEKMS
jgi:uncharacterized metal-binding protein